MIYSAPDANGQNRFKVYGVNSGIGSHQLIMVICCCLFCAQPVDSVLA